MFSIVFFLHILCAIIELTRVVVIPVLLCLWLFVCVRRSQKAGITNPNGASFVWEFCKHGQLFDLLYYTSNMEEVIARTYFKQLVAAITFLHSNNVIIEALNPNNILLDSQYNLKIGNIQFLDKVAITASSAAISNETTNDDETSETKMEGVVDLNPELSVLRGFIAPEVLHSDHLYVNMNNSEESDIFSMGVILFHLLNGYSPFIEATEENDYAQFWTQKHANCKISNNVKAQNLIQSMLSYNPQQRINMKQIKQHPWYTYSVDIDPNTNSLFQRIIKEKYNKMQIAKRSDPIAAAKTRYYQKNSSNTNSGPTNEDSDLNASDVDDVKNIETKEDGNAQHVDDIKEKELTVTKTNSTYTGTPVRCAIL